MKGIICSSILTCAFISCFAHHPGTVAGVSGTTCSSIITVTPETLPRCDWSIGIQEQFIKFDAWSTDTLKKNAMKHPNTDIETLDYISQSALLLSYGICDNLMLTLSLPYISFTEIRHAEPEGDEYEVHNQGDSNGLGDLNALFTWKFLDCRKLETSAAFLFGTTFPTGRTNVKDLHGERFAGDHQPGTGSFNPLVGLAASKKWDQNGLYANIFYTNYTNGAYHTRLGNIFNYNFSYAHQFKFALKTKSGECGEEHSHSDVAMDLSLELSGTIEGKDKLDGKINVNSGGHTIYLFPGIRVLSGKKGLGCGYLSVGFPVYQELNGSQTKSRLQVIFGMSVEI